MIKKIFGMVVALALCAGITLSASAICKPQTPPVRWMKFVFDIGGEGYIEYLKIVSVNSCGEIEAVNEYGTEFIGYRLHLATGAWLYELHTKNFCYYLDSFTFQIKLCLNPGWIWHFGEFKCWADQDRNNVNCPQCEKYCTDRHRAYITFLKKGEEPQKPTEAEYLRQYSKWQDER